MRKLAEHLMSLLPISLWGAGGGGGDGWHSGYKVRTEPLGLCELFMKICTLHVFSLMTIPKTSCKQAYSQNGYLRP